MQAKFFSLLMDGSTDHANVDDEMFIAVWCDSNGTDEKIHTKTTYFYVGRPSTVDDTGLFESLNSLHAEVIYTFRLAMRKLPAISVVILNVEVEKCANKP